MGRPPKKAAAPAKRAARRTAPAIEGVKIETLLNNAAVKVTRTTMQKGAQIPQQGRGFDYVIIPVTKFSLFRRFMRNGKVARDVELSGVPGQPYYAKATRPGVEFVVVNNSPHEVVFDKMVLKRPRQ